ncbi:MAG: hypothetical protein KDK71_02750 [Chlamydiia bacterium]|nr:hypothetical protein [Chlamydiia bacterium]
MMSVSGVSAEESYGFSYQGVKESQEETKAPVSQGVSGEGIEKLRAEEHHVQADILEKEERISRIKKLVLENSSLLHGKHRLAWIDQVASIDFGMAKEIVDSWRGDSDKVQGYVILSRYQDDQKAADILQASKKMAYCLTDDIMIYEEEKRRKFPQAEETFDLITKKLDKHNVSISNCTSFRSNRQIGLLGFTVKKEFYYREYFFGDHAFSPVEFAIRYNLPVQDKLLADLCQYLDKRSGHLGFFVSEEGLAAIKNWPLKHLRSVLNILKENIRSCNEDYKIQLWGLILAFEFSHSLLFKERERDMAEVLELVNNCGGKDISYQIGLLIKEVAPYAPHAAERFLPLINQGKKDEIILAKLRIFMGKCQDPNFDKAKAFDSLEQEISPLMSSSSPKEYLALFEAAFCAKGREEARPYFNQALQAIRKEDSLRKMGEVGKEMRKDLSARWSAFWGISEEEEGTAVDPLKGTIFQGFSEWDLLSLAKALKNTNLTEEKKQVLDGLYRLYEEDPDPYFASKILKAELALLF